MSVYLSAWNNSTLAGHIFIKFDIRIFFEILSPKFMYHYDMIRITGTLYEDQYAFFKIKIAHLFLEWEMIHSKDVKNLK